MPRRKKVPEGAVFAYFYNEAPRFGCGWRIVVPVIRGKKVSLLEVATGTRMRMPLKTWAQIAKTAKEVPRGKASASRKRRTDVGEVGARDE